MSPRTGRPTNNPKRQRLEIRLSELENKRLEDVASQIGTSKTDILMRGLQLVELQRSNREFEDLSNCLIIREFQNDDPLTEEDIVQILNYIKFLEKRYVEK